MNVHSHVACDFAACSKLLIALVFAGVGCNRMFVCCCFLTSAISRVLLFIYDNFLHSVEVL